MCLQGRCSLANELQGHILSVGLIGRPWHITVVESSTGTLSTNWYWLITFLNALSVSKVLYSMLRPSGIVSVVVGLDMA